MQAWAYVCEEGRGVVQVCSDQGSFRTGASGNSGATSLVRAFALGWHGLVRAVRRMHRFMEFGSRVLWFRCSKCVSTRRD